MSVNNNRMSGGVNEDLVIDFVKRSSAHLDYIVSSHFLEKQAIASAIAGGAARVTGKAVSKGVGKATSKAVNTVSHNPAINLSLRKPGGNVRLVDKGAGRFGKANTDKFDFWSGTSGAAEHPTMVDTYIGRGGAPTAPPTGFGSGGSQRTTGTLFDDANALSFKRVKRTSTKSPRGAKVPGAKNLSKEELADYNHLVDAYRRQGHSLAAAEEKAQKVLADPAFANNLYSKAPAAPATPAAPAKPAAEAAAAGVKPTGKVTGNNLNAAVDKPMLMTYGGGSNGGVGASSTTVTPHGASGGGLGMSFKPSAGSTKATAATGGNVFSNGAQPASALELGPGAYGDVATGNVSMTGNLGGKTTVRNYLKNNKKRAQAAEAVDKVTARRAAKAPASAETAPAATEAVAAAGPNPAVAELKPVSTAGKPSTFTMGGDANTSVASFTAPGVPGNAGNSIATIKPQAFVPTGMSPGSGTIRMSYGDAPTTLQHSLVGANSPTVTGTGSSMAAKDVVPNVKGVFTGNTDGAAAATIGKMQKGEIPAAANAAEAAAPKGFSLRDALIGAGVAGVPTAMIAHNMGSNSAKEDIMSQMPAYTNAVQQMATQNNLAKMNNAGIMSRLMYGLTGDASGLLS